jgi:hypothetical protein
VGLVAISAFYMTAECGMISLNKSKTNRDCDEVEDEKMDELRIQVIRDLRNTVIWVVVASVISAGIYWLL